MPRPYRSQWRSLAEARSDLVNREFTPVDAEAELRRAIRDAVLPGASGSGLHIRLDGSDNPWFSSGVGPWLRDSPELDFDASTILIPEWRALPLDTIETTLRLAHGQPLAARICRSARIEILDADIARFWGPENGGEMPAEPDAPEPGEPDTAPPAADVEPYKSGGQGRPTAMHLIEAEMRRRGENGELASELTKEAKHLSVWVGRAHPAAPRTTPKTIQNKLGAVYRQLSNSPKTRPTETGPEKQA
jgi:hypothetical protein